MTEVNLKSTRIASLQDQLTEDPRREPHEKETALTLAGDRGEFAISSFKRVVYEKLLRRPEFSITRVHVIRDREVRTVDSLDAVADDPSLSVVGVTGRIPVGAVSIGAARNTDSHADIVSKCEQ